jgi:hypothetical protein
MTFSGYISTSTSYSSGYSLGTIEKLSMSYQNPCDPLGWPDTPVSEQEFCDDSGASLTVTVTGRYTSSSWGTVLTWMQNVAALLTGSQYDDSQSRYLAIYEGTTYVFPTQGIHIIVESFEPTISEGTQPLIEYTLKVNQQVSY